MSEEPSGRNIDGDRPVAEEVVETAEATITEDAELERTIGLTGGLAIGIGTMIGAGIFVFPGLAGARVGTAATASFAVGGIIALLVALPASRYGSVSSLRLPSIWSASASTRSTRSPKSESPSAPVPVSSSLCSQWCSVSDSRC